MPFTAQYDVTQKLQDDMMSQFFFYVMLRPKLKPRPLTIIALLVAVGAMPFLDQKHRLWFIGALVTFYFVVTVAWVKTYFQMRAQGRAGLKVMEHPRVEITLDDEAVHYSSSTGTRRHAWLKIERIEETRDFIVLMTGKLPLMMLPKSPFNSEALTFMRRRVGTSLS